MLVCLIASLGLLPSGCEKEESSAPPTAIESELTAFDRFAGVGRGMARAEIEAIFGPPDKTLDSSLGASLLWQDMTLMVKVDPDTDEAIGIRVRHPRGTRFVRDKLDAAGAGPAPRLELLGRPCAEIDETYGPPTLDYHDREYEVGRGTPDFRRIVFGCSYADVPIIHQITVSWY